MSLVEIIYVNSNYDTHHNNLLWVCVCARKTKHCLVAKKTYGIDLYTRISYVCLSSTSGGRVRQEDTDRNLFLEYDHQARHRPYRLVFGGIARYSRNGTHSAISASASERRSIYCVNFVAVKYTSSAPPWCCSFAFHLFITIFYTY